MTVVSAISAHDVGAMHIEMQFLNVRGLMVNPEVFRRLASRCRRLMFLVRTEVAREQLRVWASPSISFLRWRVDGLKLGVMHRSRVISGMGSSGDTGQRDRDLGGRD